MKTKACSKCKIEKPLTTEFFHRGKDTVAGFKSDCKVCRNAERREYRKLNIDKEKSYKKQYYQENKEVLKEKRKVWWQNWYQRNKEVITRKKREYYKENREEEIAAVRKRQKTESGRINLVINVQRRKARMRDLPADYCKKDWINTIKFFKSCCCYCGTKGKLTKDHFVPLSRGGEFTKNNIVPACGSCNSSKHNKDFFKWYPEQSFYDKKKEKKIMTFLKINAMTQQISFF